ncbi:hypothetical protein AB7C87_12465 [Natrarchaeobius sp. A-rgal3]
MVLPFRKTIQFLVSFGLAIAVVVIAVVAYFGLVNVLFGAPP